MLKNICFVYLHVMWPLTNVREPWNCIINVIINLLPSNLMGYFKYKYIRWKRLRWQKSLERPALHVNKKWILCIWMCLKHKRLPKTHSSNTWLNNLHSSKVCSSAVDARLKHFLNLKWFSKFSGQMLCSHLTNDWSLCECPQNWSTLTVYKQ